MVELLVQHRARLAARDSFGDTPLHVAAWQGNAHVVRLLVEAKASVGQKGHRGATPLAAAALRAHLECATILLEMGASMEETDENGSTTVHAAACSGEPQMLRLMERHGAQPSEAALAAAEIGRDAGAQALLERELSNLCLAHSDAWANKMQQFSPLAQRLLVLGKDPSSIPPLALLREIVNRRPTLYPLSKFRAAQAALTASTESALLIEPEALSHAACVAVCRAIDEQGYVQLDATDGLLNRELVLTQVL